MKDRNGRRKDETPANTKRYGYIGIRPIGNLAARLDAIRDAATKRGERKTVSAIVNECVVAHLPKLESRYLPAKAA